MFHRLNGQCSSLCDVILTPPKSTDEMIKLIEFINDTRFNVLPELSKQTVEVLSCEMFLLEFIKFTDEELKQHTITYQWIDYINKVIFDSTKTIEDKSKDFKGILLNRIGTFKIELEEYKSEVDEFQELDDVNQINEYVKKSQNLDDKLTRAIEIIDEINREEKYYYMKESVYPLRKIVNTYITL